MRERERERNIMSKEQASEHKYDTLISIYWCYLYRYCTYKILYARCIVYLSICMHMYMCVPQIGFIPNQVNRVHEQWTSNKHGYTHRHIPTCTHNNTIYYSIVSLGVTVANGFSFEWLQLYFTHSHTFVMCVWCVRKFWCEKWSCWVSVEIDNNACLLILRVLDSNNNLWLILVSLPSSSSSLLHQKCFICILIHLKC